MPADPAPSNPLNLEVLPQTLQDLVSSSEDARPVNEPPPPVPLDGWDWVEKEPDKKLVEAIEGISDVAMLTAALEAAVRACKNLDGINLEEKKLPKIDLRCARMRDAKLNRIDLSEADMRGSDLRRSQMKGCNLSGAKCELAHFPLVSFEGAKFANGILDGAWLRFARFDGANFYKTQIVGASFVNAKLMLLEFDVSRDDGSIRRKGEPADLTLANVMDSDFTGATLKDATFKDAKFPPLQPPERAASGALHGAWRGKALLGSMARAAIVAAGGDDDDSDDGSDDGGGEEESRIKAKTEKAIDDVMDRLAAAAQTLMHTVDGMVEKVEALLRSSLKRGKGTRRTSSASALDADRILAELLCTKLETAADKEAAIFQTLSTHVISPLFEQHLPKVLKEARSELLKPTGDEQAGAALLLDQLLVAFTERALGAGKVALLKRLSPIVSKAVGAGCSYPKPN